MEGQDYNQQQTPAGEQPQQPQQPNPYQQQANPYQQQPNPYQQQPYQQQQAYQQPQQGQYNPYQQPQQPNPYQQQGYYQQPVARPNNGNAIAGMVLGIVSCVFCWTWYIGIPAGVVGLVLSILSKKHGPNKMATAGLICSIIGLGISAVVWIAIAACASSLYYWY